MTPNHLAAVHEEVNFFLSYPSLNIHQVNVLGALLEVFNTGVRLPDSDGFTLLHYAAHNVQEEMLMLGRRG